jgi:hypothetical protein
MDKGHNHLAGRIMSREIFKMKSKFKIAAMTSLMLLGMIGSAAAEMIFGVPAVPLGYCQLTPAAATALSTCSGGIPAGANTILMSADTANIRWRDDGTAPTSGTGVSLVFGQLPVTYNGTLSKIQFIGSGTLNVLFYKTSSP